MRNTRQRTVILETLRKMRTHPNADTLYDEVKQQLPDISLGTIYRNLDILSRKGIIREVECGGKTRRFDGNTEPHHHVRCKECSRIDDISCEDLDGVIESAGRGSDYALTGAWILFLGLCPDCREKSNGSIPNPDKPESGMRNQAGLQ